MLTQGFKIQISDIQAGAIKAGKGKIRSLRAFTGVKFSSLPGPVITGDKDQMVEDMKNNGYLPK